MRQVLGGQARGLMPWGVVGPEEAPVSLSVSSYPAEELCRDINARPAQGDTPETPTLAHSRVFMGIYPSDLFIPMWWVLSPRPSQWIEIDSLCQKHLWLPGPLIFSVT